MPKTSEEKIITVRADDGIRDGVTPESLGKIRPEHQKFRTERNLVPTEFLSGKSKQVRWRSYFRN